MPKQVFLNLPDVAQDKILQAVAEAFVDKGLRNTSAEDVAHRLNVQVDVLDRYFDGVRDMLAAVLGRAIQYFNQAYIEVGKLQKPFWERVEFLFSFASRRGFRFQAFFNTYINVFASGMPDMAQATFDRFEGRAALFFQNLILSGVQEGALRDDMDVAYMALHFQLVTRMMITRRFHPMFRARSVAYFPEITMNEDGDERFVERSLTFLKALYTS
ncbi:MAG: TetR family transcriptional regulator [Candidatus Lernaella stagnicola]|nr:TetR family transcriptional regulator [Candidatus Lernaella stagnicola]